MIKEDHVSFETAKLLKEKGFPQQRMEFAVATRDCSFIVNGNQRVKECAGTKFPYYPYSKLFLYEEDWAVLPTLQMAMKWLRKIYGIDIVIEISDPSVKDRKYYCVIWDGNNNSHILDLFNSNEEACEAAIKYCLKKLI
jgi:hypothetical protein